MGYSDEFVGFLQRLDEKDMGGFLFSHLTPGLRLLDVGCGPGNLAVQLAEAIKPGELVGIDVEPSQIEIAQQLGKKSGNDNLTFEVADVVNLPFDDSCFDVVHCGGVLGYIPDTTAALAEIKRVLRPGGTIACRDMIVDSCFAHPDTGFMRRGWQMLADLIEADDGHPQMGKDLKLHLKQAGFSDIEMSGSFDFYNTPEEINLFYGMVKGWFLGGDPAEAALKYGAATEDLLQQIGLALEAWRIHPGALVGIAFGRALAVCPQ